MFKHLLVPLDGSRLAESAIPAAVFLAKSLSASVTLFHVIELDAPETIHGERHLTDEAEAHRYLESMAKNRFPGDVSVSVHVHEEKTANVAQSIVHHTDELDPDLVIMCSHGSGGLRDLLLGNIAQQALQMGATPILLIHPEREEPEPVFRCERILVPLDVDPDHEHGLIVAVELAIKCRADLHLLAVVHTLMTLSDHHAATARLLPGTTDEYLNILAENARDHLDEKAKKFLQEGINTTFEISRGDPTRTIVKSANQNGSDLIVMGTHGKAGSKAFWSGSVAPAVSNRTHLPVLLVPLHD